MSHPPVCPLLPPATQRGAIDVGAWSLQPLLWTERLRGRALWWPKGADWFANDPLGPLPHTHPRASELYFVVSGRLDLTVGRTELVLDVGQACLIPPDTFHAPVNRAAEDLCLFVVVAPNWREARWKPEGFTEADYVGVPVVAPPRARGVLVQDEQLHVEVLELTPGAPCAPPPRPGVERVLYCLEGVLGLAVERLEGRLGPHEYAAVPAQAPHLLWAYGADACRVLVVEAEG
jgi:mannose-6-phosphate isomerase-like protein (cupin superfamily)